MVDRIRQRLCTFCWNGEALYEKAWTLLPLALARQLP
jgi:hypothetical protein